MADGQDVRTVLAVGDLYDECRVFTFTRSVNYSVARLKLVNRDVGAVSEQRAGVALVVVVPAVRIFRASREVAHRHEARAVGSNRVLRSAPALEGHAVCALGVDEVPVVRLEGGEELVSVGEDGRAGVGCGH